MRLPRPARVLAVARRDVASTLKGRRGATLGAVTAALLLPAAAVKVELPERLPEPTRIAVLGEVPPEVLALDGVFVPGGDRAHLTFRHEDGALLVRGQDVPPRVREALDGPAPRLVVVREVPSFPMPGRTALFALISASVLTGGVSESIGGERSRRTLQVLLAAAITRGELVLGKWLAWSGYGGLAALLAAAVAIGLGRVEPGWWLLPLPTVAAGTVALGLYLVRHATDVVSGAAVSLRVLPALLTVTGLSSWYLADIDPLLAAALPVGGALLAAGSTWPGAAAPLVATASTLVFCGLLVWRTAADLEEAAPPAASWVQTARETALIAGLAALAWWTPVVAPLLWGAAGNPGLTERLPPAPGVWAAALGLLAMSAVRAGRVGAPVAAFGLGRPDRRGLVVAALAGLAIAATAGGTALLPPPDHPLWAAARARLDTAVDPVWTGPVAWALAILGQELLFRGWLQRAAGPILATAAFAAVITPLDPLRGLLVGGALAGAAAAGRSVWAAVAARAVGAAIAVAWPEADPALAMAIAAVAAAAAMSAGAALRARPEGAR